MINGMMFQGFEWYLPDSGDYYKDMLLKLDELVEIGVSAIWLPPSCKAMGTNDTGYGIYDLYDLGEFDQNGAVRTKYGTKDELKTLIDAIHEKGMQVYADVVLNHKAGADFTEKFMAVKVDNFDRTKEIGAPRDIEGWTGFNFPGRQGKYSDFQWSFNHFTGVDFDQLSGEQGIFRILGEHKGWNWGVSHENGNFDYLMFADIDHANEEVKNELLSWIDWFLEELKIDGIRLDAVKHIDDDFMNDFAKHIKEQKGEEFYILGEYWDNNLKANRKYMRNTEYGIDLFDVGLHFNLFEASHSDGNFDLRKIFDDTVVASNPPMCVTFVDNHDSEPGQALSSFVELWFKEIAYALILLRKDGYPCVFYGDYYGIGGEYMIPGMKDKIDRLAKIRKDYAYGEQNDYFNEPDLMGWVRRGDEEHPAPCAAIISLKEKKSIRMFMGEEERGKRYRDLTGNCQDLITIDEENYGEFVAEPGSLSVWMEESTRV